MGSRSSWGRPSSSPHGEEKWVADRGFSETGDASGLALGTADDFLRKDDFSVDVLGLRRPWTAWYQERLKLIEGTLHHRVL